MHHDNKNNTNKNNNEEDKEEEETNDSVNASVALAVWSIHTRSCRVDYSTTLEIGKVAKNLESDAYAMLHKAEESPRDGRFTVDVSQSDQDSYYDDDDDDTTNTNKKKNNNKEFRSNCRTMERKLFSQSVSRTLQTKSSSRPGGG